MQDMVRVLFVCMGNICRSPTAEGVFRHLIRQEGLAQRIQTDSAGTHAYHIGEPPDRRAQSTAVKRGIDISDLRARKVTGVDFDEFHYVLAMDNENLSRLLELCPPRHHERVHLFMDFAQHLGDTEVPDPYYGGQRGFDHVFDLVEAASRGLLTDIQQRFLASVTGSQTR